MIPIRYRQHKIPGNWIYLIFFSAVLWVSTAAYADVGISQVGSDFDHLSTGFFLSPAHRNAECGACHINNVYKGTPKRCESCHMSSAVITALGKNPGHINSGNDCSECHGENTVKWSEISFKSHDQVIGDCKGCHDNKIAIDKPGNHILSDDKCETCHSNTSTFKVGLFDHSNTTSNCYSCHDGKHAGASTKGVSHMSSSMTCESCHNALSKSWLSIVNVDHSDVLVGTCDDCHSAQHGVGPIKSNRHIPSSKECDDCHITTSFFGASYDHTGVTSNCFSCHDGRHSGADGMSRRHMRSSNTCESCHNALTKDWYSIVNVDHSDVLVGTCDDCHSARNEIGPVKTPDHIPSSDECDVCHVTSTFTGALYDHGGVTTNCYSCHDGNHLGARGVSRRHMPSSTTCESCHNALTKDWYSIVNVDHSDVLQGTCRYCHAGRGAVATVKPANHIPSSRTCDNCHLNAGVTFSGATDLETATLPLLRSIQSSVAEQPNVARQEVENSKAEQEPDEGFVHPDDNEKCIACHDGLIAQGKKQKHLSTDNKCSNCHRVQAWLPLKKFDHDSAKGSCVSCHNGQRVDGKSATHLNTLDTCEDCHQTIGWSVNKFDHTAAIGNCFSCHNRKNAIGKPLNHISSDNNCDNCHITLTWTQVVMDHGNVTGSCSQCHNGTIAQAKPARHITSGNTCNDCHRRRSWTPVYRVDHLAVSGTCFSCHNGSVSGGKPGNHPETHNQCEECHRSNLWSLVTFNHENLSRRCIDCHLGNYKQQSHKKSLQGREGYYPANELADCAGSCHVYEDSTFSEIAIQRPGPEHRPQRGAW